VISAPQGTPVPERYRGWYVRRMAEEAPRAPEPWLVAAVEDNLFDLFRAFGRLPGAELDESGSLLRH
jgi:hypothetical protein